jgi:hypothetical protein
MRRLCLLFCLGLLTAGAPRVMAEDASASDIRQLQREVDRLEDSLDRLDDRDPNAAEFRRREDRLLDDLTSLRAQVRRQQDDPGARGVSTSEIESLRRSIVDLRTDVEKSAAVARRDDRDDRADRATASVGTVPAGTELDVRLDDRVSSETARREDRVGGTLVAPVRVDGRIVIPRGATVLGTVRDVVRAERPSKAGRVDLSFDTLVLPDGGRVRIPARVTSVGESGIDKKKAGLGAVVGGILGAVVDGGKGAVIGAALGGGGTIAASRGDDVDLPSGSIVTLRLDDRVNLERDRVSR